MCKQCEPRCPPKHCKKCVEKHVIKCLPYSIHKSGQYCLGKDFHWSDAAQSAITITADNVVLDFNQRVITITVATTNSVVYADGVKDLVLDNVHLETSGDGSYAADGVDIRNSSAVTINSPRFFNNRIALYTEVVKGLEIHDLYLENEDASLSPSLPILLYLVDNLKFFDSSVKNGRTLIGAPLNADIQRLQSHNSIPSRFTGKCLEFFSSTVVNKVFTNTVPIRTSSNVHVSECELISENGIALFAFGQSPGQFGLDFAETNELFLIENNVITGGGLAGSAIDLQNFRSGAIVKCNQLKTTGNFAAGVLAYGKDIRIQNNNIICDAPESLNIGILLFAPDLVAFPEGKRSEYCFVDNNSVTGASFRGFTENFAGRGTYCAIFKDNMATGNVVNYSFDPVTYGTVESNNLESCVTVEVESLSKNLQEMFSDHER